MDKYFSKIIQQTITAACKGRGLDKSETIKFREQFLANMLVIMQQIKLKLMKELGYAKDYKWSEEKNRS